MCHSSRYFVDDQCLDFFQKQGGRAISQFFLFHSGEVGWQKNKTLYPPLGLLFNVRSLSLRSSREQQTIATDVPHTLHFLYSGSLLEGVEPFNSILSPPKKTADKIFSPTLHLTDIFDS